MTKTRQFELLLLLTTMIWGMGFPLTQILITNGFGPFTVMSGRFFIGSLVLVVIFYKRLRFMNKQTIYWGVITGILLFLGFAFQTVGIVYTTPSKNAMITQMMVIIVPFIIWFITKQRPNKHVFTGAMTALLGGVILTANFNDFGAINLGDFLTFLCAVMVAAHVVLSATISKKDSIDTVNYTLIQFLFAAAVSMLLIPLETTPIITIENIWPLMVLGVLNTAWGFTIQTFAHRYSNASRTSVIVTTEAFFAAVFSILLGQELLTYQLIIGGSLLLGAVYYVTTKGQGYIQDVVERFT